MRKKKTLEAAQKAWQGIDQLNARIDPSRLDDHILGTYLYLRRIMTWLAVLLPIVMVLGGLFGLFWSGRIEPQDSLSAYYHANSLDPCSHHNGAYRDLFVGFLAAISVCLIAYKGYTKLEDYLLSAAGLLLAGVAFFPMGWPERIMQTTCQGRDPFKGDMLFGIPNLSIHFVCAVSFFILLYIIIWKTSGSTLDIAREKGNSNIDLLMKEINYWKGRYVILRKMMFSTFILLLFGILWQMNPLNLVWFTTHPWNDFPLIAEAAGIWIFAGYWSVKTQEIRATRSFISN